MSDYRDEASGRFVYTHVLSHIIRKGLSMRTAAHREKEHQHWRTKSHNLRLSANAQ